MYILLILLFIICFMIWYIILLRNQIKTQNKIDKKTIEENIKIESEKNKLLYEIDTIDQEIKKYNQQLNNSQQQVLNMEKVAQQSFEQYCDVLDTAYQDANKKHDAAVTLLQEQYNVEKNKKIAEMEQVQNDLEQLKQTRAAAIQAQLKEKEIKEKLSFYCLQVSQQDLNDIKLLESIKPRMKNTRVICKLIWSDYFQKQMTQLCNQVLNTSSIVTGIYKITNVNNGMCYIGQARECSR